jgi:hypothetical protein
MVAGGATAVWRMCRLGQETVFVAAFPLAFALSAELCLS